jgi:hypothetical protein
MSDDEIAQMLADLRTPPGVDTAYLKADVLTLIKGVRNTEREACARVADKRAATGEYGTWQAQEGKIIADEIRNRI